MEPKDTTLDARSARADTLRNIVFHDDFSAGFSVGGDDARWTRRAVASFPHGDGIVTTGPDGLEVVPTETDSATSLPAFAMVPQPLGDTERLRWTAMANRSAPSGFSGFDVGTEGALAVRATLAVEGYNLERHPYGDAVADPRRDLRVGAGLLVTVDLESGLVLDFIVTDGCVVAVYERLALPGTRHGAFSYAVPVLDRYADDHHDLTISYDAGSGVARWYVDDAEVLVVDRLGERSLDAVYLRRDNGLPEQPASPRQLNCGFGLFADRLFGQGVRLRVGRVQVGSRPAADAAG